MSPDSELRKYPAVRILIGVIRLFAAVPTFIGIFTILAGGTELFRQKPGITLLMALALSVGPLLLGLLLFAASECLKVLLDIEANTRGTFDEINLLPLVLRNNTDSLQETVHNR